ncbi:hypothetical protein R3P38DRAFT_3102841 [Favolaschia claudopus]|uniref:Indoleamine 2,3-dioxygenase n=1 Tax=Favolaschia claudopus TaxID=2862362 RepID=A0AAV9ZKQ8_9AGAR
MLSWIFSFWSPSLSRDVTVEPDPKPIIHEPSRHRSLELLRDLVELGGGGAWPPIATYENSWPSVLQPYHWVSRIMEPLLPVEEPSLDCARNREIIDSFRARMRFELAQRINTSEVDQALEEWETHDTRSFQSAWLGFFACISFLRHAYRWGTIPIVSAAQSEVSVVFPAELELPWRVLQRHFGISSPSGCLTSICYSNLTAGADHVQYSATIGMGDLHRSTEFSNTKFVIDIESMMLPVYTLFAKAIAYMDAENPDAARDALHTANDLLRTTLKFFFNTMVERTLSPKVWMAYVQGFQGWALDNTDGSSGAQTLIFRTLDSFLGIKPWPTLEQERLHVPEVQRNWLNYLRTYDIRSVAKGREYVQVTAELDSLVKQLRLWRMGHMRRMQVYESVHRPERKTMTAGISVVDAPDEEQMILRLKTELGKRLAQTV